LAVLALLLLLIAAAGAAAAASAVHNTSVSLRIAVALLESSVAMVQRVDSLGRCCSSHTRHFLVVYALSTVCYSSAAQLVF
jgi:hypothetical protein